MAGQTGSEQFESSWAQTASWAQQQGYKYNQYYPVYQQDSQRYLQYGQGGTMSTAERETAIQAAANPTKATQATPSTASNPSNVIGNTISDVRDIFTGLGDVVIHPLNNGIVDSFKNTFDLIDGDHHLMGHGLAGDLGQLMTSTVLGFIPGVSDVGTILQAGGLTKGLDELADHPVGSLLDLMGTLQPVRIAGMLGGDEAATALADRAGLTSDMAKAKHAGVIRVGKGLVLNTKTADVGTKIGGGLGRQTLGDKLANATGRSMLNVNGDIADAMGGAQSEVSHYDNVRLATFAPWIEAREHLNDAQVAQVTDILAKAEKTNLEDAMKDVTDPAVKNAVNAWMPIHDLTVEEGLNATTGPRIVRNIRTGIDQVFSLTGHKTVHASRAELSAAAKALFDSPNMAHMDQLREAGEAADGFFQQATQGVMDTNLAARQIRETGNIGEKPGETPITLPGNKRPTPFGKARIATEGTNSIFGLGGWVDRVGEKAQAGDYETVAVLGPATLKRMDSWSERTVDAADHPEWQAVRAEVEKLTQAAQSLKEVKKQIDKEAYGSAKEWKGGKGYRDEMHAEAEKAMKAKQRLQIQKVTAGHKKTADMLERAYNLKRKTIRSQLAAALHQRAIQVQNITERFELEKGKATTRNLLDREAHGEWKRGRTAQGFTKPRDRAQALQEGWEVAPGGKGTPEANLAAHNALEVQKQAEILSLPSEAAIKLRYQKELTSVNKLETEMNKDLETQQAKDIQKVSSEHADALKRFRKDQIGKKSRDGKFSQLVNDYLKAHKKFEKALYDHPSDNYQPVWFDMFAKNLIEDERAKASVVYKSGVLARKYGWDQEYLDRLHGDKKTMATLVQIGLHDAFDDPIFNDLDKALIRDAQESAYKLLDDAAKNGLNPMWIHHTSATVGESGIRLIVGHGVPKPDMLDARAWGLSTSKFDIMASISHPMRQFLNAAVIRDYVSKYLDPRVVTEQDVIDMVLEYHKEEVASLMDNRQDLLDFAKVKMGDWGLEEFDPEAMFGFRAPRWGEGKVYLDKNLTKAVKGITSDGGFLKGGVIEKGTKLFRYSILGLSPRYTAHITFGGTFLLALHEPLFFLHIPEMLDNMKNGLDPEDLQTTSTQMGTTAYQIDSLPKALKWFHRKGGEQTGRLLAQHELEVNQGIAWKSANPVQWLKAMADVNLKFTTTLTHMQKSLAYLSARDRALKTGMTEERAIYEGMKSAAHVMGDLRRMSPFERDVARTVMPFYGWQKHILSYVLSYPADHPWRTVMLSQMAEFDTQNTPGGLPSRYQFLMFLGTPDAQGNVTAVDARAMNPLRDVANYATWGGLIGSLNPLITASFAAIDPEVIYGGNELYPNLTYDQFYGIEEAGPQGNLVTAASQIVPQISGIQSALQVASQRQGMSDKNLVQSIANQLNFPWVPEHINIRQEAAKTAIARYHVTSSLATQAWQTGDFQSISDLGSVPDPQNPDYQIPVSDLENLYNTLAKEYPDQPPSETATPLPSVHL